MKREEFLQEMDALLERPAGSLKGPENLEDLECWDSTAMIGFIALVDSQSGQKLSPRDITKCTTVEDLLKLANV